MKRVVIDCFQLRVKAGNDGQRAALRSRRWEMRDCDGGCGAVPLAAAVERRRRRGPKGKRLRVGPLRTRHKRLPVRVWPPATNKKQFHCVWAPATRAHTHTQCHRVHGGQSCTFLNRLWVHIPKNKTQHTSPFVPNSCSPLVKRVAVCCALLGVFCEGLFALDEQPKRRSGLCVGWHVQQPAAAPSL